MLENMLFNPSQIVFRPSKKGFEPASNYSIKNEKLECGSINHKLESDLRKLDSNHHSFQFRSSFYRTYDVSAITSLSHKYPYDSVVSEIQNIALLELH
jgi:hypothetical protein